VSLLLSIFAVLAGLAFGSFLNVCISRLPQHESIVAPRSRCPNCFAPIRSSDNIPVLSFLLLKGRCRDCGAPISPRYPLIEATTAALFLLCFLQFGLSLSGIGTAVLCWLLLGLAATDAETLRLPDALTLPGLALGVLYSGIRGTGGDLSAFEASSNATSFDILIGFQWKAAAESLLWAAGAAVVILLIRGIYWLARRREGMGLGDAKLLAMIAAWLGLWPTLLTLFLGVLSAAVYGLVITRLPHKQPPSGEIPTVRLPLGAFLCAAALFVVFRGERIVNWYLSFWP
jgi:leader peptidase (prepilin peptidase)/N-methyltransferase